MAPPPPHPYRGPPLPAPPDIEEALEAMEDRVAHLERKVGFAHKVIIALAGIALTSLGGGIVAVYRAGVSSGALDVRLDVMENRIEHSEDLTEWLIRRDIDAPIKFGAPP